MIFFLGACAIEMHKKKKDKNLSFSSFRISTVQKKKGKSWVSPHSRARPPILSWSGGAQKGGGEIPVFCSLYGRGRKRKGWVGGEGRPFYIGEMHKSGESGFLNGR